MQAVVCFDTETALIRPSCTAPPITCLTWSTREGASMSADLSEMRGAVMAWLKSDSTLIVGHNVAFDLAVVCAEWSDLVPLVFAAYDANRVTDTMLRQKLIDIARGRYWGFLNEEDKWVAIDYSLASCARRLAGIPVKKEGFRLFYAPFRGVPLEQWEAHARALQSRGAAYISGTPDAELEKLESCLGDREKFAKELRGMIDASPAEVLSYPIDDAIATRAVFEAQEQDSAFLVDQFRQARKAFAQHLTSAWGLRTNAIGVSNLRASTEKACESLEAELKAAGLIRANGVRDTKAAEARIVAVCETSGLPIRKTDKGKPSLDADACKSSGDPLLESYAELTSLKTVLNKDIPALASGTVYPIHTRFDMASSGRTTSSSPNVQNWRRLPGIREVFTPRKGHHFIQADYSGLELATLAQVCLDLLGESNLATVINSGLDPHTELASKILNITPEEGRALRKAKDARFDDARQTSKVANFGLPGGLGPAKLSLFAKKSYGVEISKARAQQLKNEWLAQWPEMHAYFKYVNGLTNFDKSITLNQVRSGRIRRCPAPGAYTAACNSFFQGLGADATAAAMWLVSKACYLDRSSVLFGCRIVNYIHDEFILEAPIDRAPECAEELSRLMVEGVKPWLPDLKISAEPCVMTLWSKEAKTLRDDSGRLMAWSPAA